MLGRPKFILKGWAARVRILPDGRRQIFNFVLPGEGLGVCARPNPLALSTVVALTPVQYVDAGPVQRAISGEDPRYSELRDALHVSASLDEAYLLAQIMRLGRQTAYERLCHLLLEIRDRLMLVGLASETDFPMPMTQETLADASGLSIVHVNRILQQLRREQLLELQGGKAHLREPHTLATISDYKPACPTVEISDRTRA
ncbi:Crp/Fnr family transcriptional regulator [Phenylobacterium sp. LjRoot164]|uniref:Crp/Fnr family transcriptional regulator n=1 Tax=unclassified Phenylobacterium TaxID=2640670 RepID=UPI003ECD4AC7